MLRFASRCLPPDDAARAMNSLMIDVQAGVRGKQMRGAFKELVQRSAARERLAMLVKERKRTAALQARYVSEATV